MVVPKKKVETQESIKFDDKFIVYSADLSLRRPGFCMMELNKVNDKYEITQCQTMSVDNKTYKKGKSKTHGEILGEIEQQLNALFAENNTQSFFIREHAFNSRGAMSEIGIFEVVGLTNYALWKHRQQEWKEVYPITVKKTMTGNSKADKVEVAKAINNYIKDKEFANDDESDATAVGIAWLILNNVIQAA